MDIQTEKDRSYLYQHISTHQVHVIHVIYFVHSYITACFGVAGMENKRCNAGKGRHNSSMCVTVDRARSEQMATPVLRYREVSGRVIIDPLLVRGGGSFFRF
jgi:hypothetical protein